MLIHTRKPFWNNHQYSFLMVRKKENVNSEKEGKKEKENSEEEVGTKRIVKQGEGESVDILLEETIYKGSKKEQAF